MNDKCLWRFDDGDSRWLPHDRDPNGVCVNCFEVDHALFPRWADPDCPHPEDRLRRDGMGFVCRDCGVVLVTWR